MNERTRILIKKLQGWFTGQPTGPYKIQLNPTNKCNLNCLSCSARGKVVYAPSTEVSIERYIDLVKEAKELGVLYCDICGGGEPFARAEITLAIMRELKKHDIIGSVMTNGTLFSEESIRILVEIGWDFVNLSIDGPDARINDYLRGKGTLDKNVEAIRLFNFWKKKLKKDKPHLSIYSVISKKNYKHINKLLDLVITLQIEGLYLQPIVVAEGKGQELVMSEKDAFAFEEILNKLKPRFLENKIKSNIEFIDPPLPKKSLKNKSRKEQVDGERTIPCYSPWLMVVIRADGVIGLCPPSVEFIEGANIKNQSLKEVWNGEIFNEFRKKIIENKKPSGCKNCGSMETIANIEITKMINKKLNSDKKN